MVHYKLVYFNARGRAEIARLMLAEAGVDYEDYRFDFSQWPAEKESKLVSVNFLVKILPIFIY